MVMILKIKASTRNLYIVVLWRLLRKLYTTEWRFEFDLNQREARVHFIPNLKVRVLVSSPGEFHPHALRTGLETLTSSGSHYPAPKGLVLSFGSSLVTKVDRSSKLDNTIPSLHAHYRHFITTTNCSVPAHCIDTFVLTGLPLGVFS